MFYGDLIMPIVFSRECIEMPTAIIRAYTPEGFVIAADGRARDEHGIIVSDSVQKVFQIPGANMVYAVWGSAIVTRPSTEEVVLDVRSDITTVAGATNTNDFQDTTSLVSHLCQRTSEELTKFPSKGMRFLNKPIQPGNDGSEILSIFFWGYHKGSAFGRTCSYFHRDQTLLPMVPARHNLSGDPLMVAGSADVARILNNPLDRRLLAFRSNAMHRWKVDNLMEGIDMAVKYIHACESTEGAALDPALCPGIGGHIHIAVIKPSGVSWAEGYEPPAVLWHP